MGRRCAVCTDETRPIVESGIALGESYADLAARTGLSADSIARHAKRHIKGKLTNATSLEEQLDTWLSRINVLYHAAASIGDSRVQVEAIKSALNILASKQAIAEQRAKQEAGNTGSDGKPSLSMAR